MWAPVPAALPAEPTCERSQLESCEQHRVLDVDVTAEGAGQADTVHVSSAHVLHQQLDTRV